MTIVGSNFLSGTTVTFGDSTATNVVFVSSDSITATTPAHPAGTVDMIATNPDGQADTLFNGFTFIVSPPPVLTSVNPTSGLELGGTSVTITGSNFLSGTTVTFGDSTATNVVVMSSDTITATIPTHPVGTVDVIVTNPDGLSGTLSDGFTFIKLVPGNFDGDDEVGLSDFVLFLDVFGATTGSDNSLFDLDGNGEVGLSDFVIFLDSFGTSQ